MKNWHRFRKLGRRIMKNGWYLTELWKAYKEFQKKDLFSEKITAVTSLTQLKQPRCRRKKMILHRQVERVLVMMINSILREVIPTIKCVNSRFKYEKLSHSVNQFTFVVKVHSFLKKINIP